MGQLNVFPIYGIEIAFEDGKLIYKGEATKLFNLDPDKHGWERFGQDHNGLLANGQPTKPYVEGAWVTKHGGKYYLQYGAPGTEFNAYANGTYVSDKPLGPFEYADYNPIAYKPGGFVEGAGHGSTFQDEHGNWWNTGTPWIGYNWTFERRINMFPTKFEADGQMWASSRFGDFPQYMPTKKVDDINSLFTGWMLLSYRKPATASSTMGEFAADRVDRRGPAHLLGRGAEQRGRDADGRSRRGEDGARGAGQLRRLQVGPLRRRAGHLHRVRAAAFARRPELAAAGEARRPAPRPAERLSRAAAAGPHALHPLRPRPYRRSEPRDQRPARVRQRRRPRSVDVPGGVVGQRHQDQRDATIRWAKVPGAVGYNIRFGIERRPADADLSIVGGRARQRRDAAEGPALAERRRALLGRGRGVQRDGRVEAQPRREDALISRASRR